MSRLDDEVQVIALNRKVREAHSEPLARRGELREKESAESFGAQGRNAVAETQGDVNWMSRAQ